MLAVLDMLFIVIRIIHCFSLLDMPHGFDAITGSVAFVQVALRFLMS